MVMAGAKKQEPSTCTTSAGDGAAPGPVPDLVRGLPGPAGWRIRLARPRDVDAVQRLLPLAEPGLDDEGAMLAQHPGLAAGLQRALRHGPDALLLRDSAGAVVRRPA
jgi:hypothetical protein